MHIQLNGELYTLENVQSVAGLLEHLQLAGRRVAVELNFEIVHAIGGG